MTLAFIQLQMFAEQNGRKAGSVKMESAVPFKQWKVGYIVRGSQEDFTIKRIDSSDGAMHYQDCTVELENKAGETRVVKGSTLQSGYNFVSKGDVVEPPTERTDVIPFGVNAAGIREFYPRKSGEGTRILMMDKTAYIVADSFEDVTLKIKIASTGPHAVAGRTENVGSSSEDVTIRRPLR